MFCKSNELYIRHLRKEYMANLAKQVPQAKRTPLYYHWVRFRTNKFVKTKQLLNPKGNSPEDVWQAMTSTQSCGIYSRDLWI